mgnify:CR=1 FL=1
MGYCTLPVTAFEQNCSIAWCDETRKAVIVDPGGDEERIIAAVESEVVEPVMVALTHGHLDHVGGGRAGRAAALRTLAANLPRARSPTQRIPGARSAPATRAPRCSARGR